MYEDIALEVGFKLNKEQSYYEDIIKKHNGINSYNCETHDIYWTNKDLDGLTENEMKNSCIRLRITRGISGKDTSILFKIKRLFGVKNKYLYSFQNYSLIDSSITKGLRVSKEEVDKYIKKIENLGYHKVFDTYKTDYQYRVGNMKSRLQLQNIKNIGLLLYYDNPDIYNLPLEEQRRKLIDEINSYGFDFKYSDLGLDKLRTLYYKEEKYSSNQNG